MRRRLVALGAAAVAVGVALGCQPDLEKQSQLLDRVRLLALRADPPEADVRDGGLPPPITFAPLAYPDGGLTFRLAVCGPGNFFAADFDCPGGNGLDLPDLVLDASRPEVLAFLQAAFGSVSALDGGINVGEPGVAQIAIGYDLSRVDGGSAASNHERGIYRLAVRFSGAPNHNPELLDVTLADGGTLQGAALPLNQEIRFYPHIPDGGPGGIETYVGLDGGVQSERFGYSWEATAGEVVDFRSAEPIPEDPNATSDIRFRTHEIPGPVRIYVVLRDLRGGVSWKVFDATLGP
ncbi:MAG TPA: hypothetical protein VGG91_17115 [Myxococcaceae bacterium]|jgi:hypothetical protein